MRCRFCWAAKVSEVSSFTTCRSSHSMPDAELPMAGQHGNPAESDYRPSGFQALIAEINSSAD